MKYLKKFEDVSRLPKLQDWVVIDPNPDWGMEKNEIFGQIIQEYPNKRYIIRFEATNKEKTLGVDQLKYWADTKKELEYYIKEIKYNI